MDSACSVGVEKPRALENAPEYWERWYVCAINRILSWITAAHITMRRPTVILGACSYVRSCAAGYYCRHKTEMYDLSWYQEHIACGLAYTRQFVKYWDIL